MRNIQSNSSEVVLESIVWDQPKKCALCIEIRDLIMRWFETNF